MRPITVVSETDSKESPARGLDSQALAALGAARVDHGATATGLHADQEAVGTGAAGLGTLVSAFHAEPLDGPAAPDARPFGQGDSGGRKRWKGLTPPSGGTHPRAARAMSLAGCVADGSAAAREPGHSVARYGPAPAQSSSTPPRAPPRLKRRDRQPRRGAHANASSVRKTRDYIKESLPGQCKPVDHGPGAGECLGLTALKKLWITQTFAARVRTIRPLEE